MECNGTCDFGGVWPKFLLIFKKNRVCFRFFLNYIKFDDSYLIEQKIFYIFPPNNILLAFKPVGHEICSFL